MADRDTYAFKDSVKSGIAIFGGLLAVLVITIPVAIYFFMRRNSGKLVFDDKGFTVTGLGLTSSRWNYDEIERLGHYSVRLAGGGIGGSIARKMNGDNTAVNLMAKTKSGKTLKFMASRFQDTDAIIGRVQSATGLPVETVTQGVMGLKWPKTA